MKLDPAVVELLGLDITKTTVSAIGSGSSSATTAKIATKDADGSDKLYFMKTADNDLGRLTMLGEHKSLTAISSAVPGFCPQSFGWGAFKSLPTFTHFLVTEFLQVSPPASSSSFTVTNSLQPTSRPATLAKNLAQLHSHPAPPAEGYSTPQYGFPVTTCCGDTPQDNEFKDSWAEFFADNRLKFILERADTKHGTDKELKRLVEATVSNVVSRLLRHRKLNGGKGIVPALVHGDLWSGNTTQGSLSGREVQDVIYDPSACYAHNEYELSIMKMFGGFSDDFFTEYHKLYPKTEPVEEYDDRIALYQVYHYLNHHALFGGSYKSSAMEIMNCLLQKYGSTK